jgi:tight adherence protein C
MIESLPYAIAIGGAASAFLLAISCYPAESPMAARLKKMERVKEKSILQRVAIIEQIVGDERGSHLGGRLIEAGWYTVTPAAFRLRSIGASGIGAVLGLSVFLFLFKGSVMGFAAALLAAVVAGRIPNIMLLRAIKARKESIEKELPDFLDLLASTVQAGLALNAALLQAVDAAHGALKEELKSMLAEIRLGRPRADAFNAFAQRVKEDSVTTMVTAIVQAERLGSNLSQVLQELAKETRERRWTRAEERAMQLPIKMIVPMALFMIPSLYLMIFGPVVARLAMNR